VKKNDIVIGLVILALLAGALYFFKKPKQKVEDLSLPTTESRLEDSFKLEIPDDLEKADLRDVSGGNGSGIATRDFSNGRFTHMILADLPELTPGSFYQGWLVKGDDLISTGTLRIAKGGYLLELSTPSDYTTYSKVLVTMEKVTDSKPEITILEGNF
jgi:hypothetical protein